MDELSKATKIQPKTTTTTTTTTTSNKSNEDTIKKNKPIKIPKDNGIIKNNNVSLSKVRKQFGSIKLDDFIIDGTQQQNTTNTTTTTTVSNTSINNHNNNIKNPIKKKKVFIIKEQKEHKPTKLKKDMQLFLTIKDNYIKGKPQQGSDGIDFLKNQTFTIIPNEVNEMFKAAGVLLYSIHDNKIKLLMGCEDRTEKLKKNPTSSFTNQVFLPFGGKVENGENSIDTATREFNEETGFIFNNEIEFYKQLFQSEKTQKFWIPSSKYVLFIAPIEFDDSIPLKFQNIDRLNLNMEHTDQLFMEWIDQQQVFKSSWKDPFFIRPNGSKGECIKFFISMMGFIRPFFNKIVVKEEAEEREKEKEVKDNNQYLQEYINQILPNIEINNTCKELIGILRKFQEKSYQNNTPDKVKKRYVSGLRETLKLVESNKISCVIITPTIEENGALNKIVEDIIKMCRSKNVLYTFALSSRVLGKLIGKTIKISVLGILDYDGANEIYQKLFTQTKQSRDEFIKLQKKQLQIEKQQQEEEVPVLAIEDDDKIKLMIDRKENIQEYKQIESLFKEEKKIIKKQYKEKQKEYQVIRQEKQELELKKEQERKRLKRLQKQQQPKENEKQIVVPPQPSTSVVKKSITTPSLSTIKKDVSDQLLYDNTNEFTNPSNKQNNNKKKNKR